MINRQQRKRGRPGKYYTVYLNTTDAIIASGSARECATQLGVKPKSFHSLVSRCLTGGNKKYSVVIDDTPYDEEE